MLKRLGTAYADALKKLDKIRDQQKKMEATLHKILEVLTLHQYLKKNQKELVKRGGKRIVEIKKKRKEVKRGIMTGLLCIYVYS